MTEYYVPVTVWCESGPRTIDVPRDDEDHEIAAAECLAIEDAVLGAGRFDPPAVPRLWLAYAAMWGLVDHGVEA